MNARIRRSILSFLTKYGSIDSRELIGIMAQRFQTSRQRISGNISWMVMSGAVGLTVIHPGRESVLYP